MVCRWFSVVRQSKRGISYFCRNGVVRDQVICLVDLICHALVDHICKAVVDHICQTIILPKT